MSLVKEFKEFAMRGNVIDLAVGVIMGAAFGKIVSSLVADVLMPPIGYLVGGVKFTDLKASLPKMNETQEAASINYGNFLQATFDFIIVALCIFALVKVINRLKRKKEEAPPAPAEPPADVKLLTEIRDLLKARQA